MGSFLVGHVGHESCGQYLVGHIGHGSRQSSIGCSIGCLRHGYVGSLLSWLHVSLITWSVVLWVM